MKNKESKDIKDSDEELEIEKEDRVKKIELGEEDKKIIIENSKSLKKILQEDKGTYIISCLENIPTSNFDQQMFDNLVKFLRYDYSHGVVNLILLSLINPPFLIREIKKVIQDETVNKFIDEIKIKYGYRVSKSYLFHIGECDWQYIRSHPIVRDDAIALMSDITLANGEKISFTAPLKSVPIISYHFLKHINSTIDFLKERAISEISIKEINRVSKELEKLLSILEDHEKKKVKKLLVKQSK